MEKFAVDLDRMLDELEYNEDCAEHMVIEENQSHKGSSHSSSAEIPPAYKTFETVRVSDVASSSSSSSVDNVNRNTFNDDSVRSGELAWRPKSVPISQKTSVSGVFSSLNEYINSGSRLAASGSLDETETNQLSWTTPSKNLSPNEEKPDLIDSRVFNLVSVNNTDSDSLDFNVSKTCEDAKASSEFLDNNDLMSRTEDIGEQQSSNVILLPDIATTGVSSSIPTQCEEANSSLDLISHRGSMSDIEYKELLESDKVDAQILKNDNLTSSDTDNFNGVCNFSEVKESKTECLNFKNVQNMDASDIDDFLETLEVEEKEVFESQIISEVDGEELGKPESVEEAPQNDSINDIPKSSKSKTETSDCIETQAVGKEQDCNSVLETSHAEPLTQDNLISPETVDSQSLKHSSTSQSNEEREFVCSLSPVKSDSDSDSQSESVSPPTPPTVPVTPTMSEPPSSILLSSAVATLTSDIAECFVINNSEEQESSNVDADLSSPQTCGKPARPNSLQLPKRVDLIAGSSDEPSNVYSVSVGPPGATPCANRSLATGEGTLVMEREESATDSSVADTSDESTSESPSEDASEVAAVSSVVDPENDGVETRVQGESDSTSDRPNGTSSSADESAEVEGAVGGDVPSGTLSPAELQLGKLPPFWIPDADAPSCMLCDQRFNVIKRRHHCRACGKVLCSKCCHIRVQLEYLEAAARVCDLCNATLSKVAAVERGEEGDLSNGDESGLAGRTRSPNPNNPMDYCSTVPPLQQVADGAQLPTPSVMVPVGVLKREGSVKPKSETKQVMFSDGIRPGGDLAELDGSDEPRLHIRRGGRISKRVESPQEPTPKRTPRLDSSNLSYIPRSEGLPPRVVKGKGFEEDLDPASLLATMRDDDAPPVKFAINRNLYLHVKILNLDCCVHRVCWCFTSEGLSCVGQDEVVIILEVQPEEATVPRDIFLHLNTLYHEASKGNTVTEMGHTLTQGAPFLGSREHGGFLYVRPTFQCLHKLIIPPAPYLIGVLLNKWETPWARIFPIRLMLRLGAEFRYYPCPLISVRDRPAVYGEIGHTIINVLADFRNMMYTLPTVRGLVIHMEDKQTTILFPRNRYDQVVRALNNSNDHVLAFGANFSQAADSHLVCMQSTESTGNESNYFTQAINIHRKPRKVTGASFVVFNGGLKTSCGMAAKSSIVEDGLMVKVTSETLGSLQTALRDMKDFSITCGPINASSSTGPVSDSGSGAGDNPPDPPIDEVVLIKWTEDDLSFNIGVLSNVDGRPLDGVPSIRVHNGTDYEEEFRFIRWTEVFILKSDEGSGRTGDPADLSRLSERLAKATCKALVKLLALLAAASLTTLAVRATIHPDNVGYLAGSNGERLPPIYMKSLDDELIPVIHEATSLSGESPVVLELVFRVMESGM